MAPKVVRRYPRSTVYIAAVALLSVAAGWVR